MGEAALCWCLACGRAAVGCIDPRLAFLEAARFVQCPIFGGPNEAATYCTNRVGHLLYTVHAGCGMALAVARWTVDGGRWCTVHWYGPDGKCSARWMVDGGFAGPGGGLFRRELPSSPASGPTTVRCLTSEAAKMVVALRGMWTLLRLRTTASGVRSPTAAGHSTGAAGVARDSRGKYWTVAESRVGAHLRSGGSGADC